MCHASSTAGAYTMTDQLAVQGRVFYNHLMEAIQINKNRKQTYADLTDNKSKSVSNRLIFYERLCLPLAKHFDKRAESFDLRGIPIIRADFVPMDDIKDADTPPVYTNTVNRDEFREVKTILKQYKRQVRKNLENTFFEGVCDFTLELLFLLDDLEQKLQAHFAMTRHLLESIGLHGYNAISYARQSGGDTVHISRQMVSLYVMALNFGMRLDRSAQKLHAMGAGIVVNDLPSIPFLSKWLGFLHG